MKHGVRAYVPHVLVAGFIAWCAYSVRRDLVQISPAALARSWDTVALACLLSLLSYVVRIVRWRTYLTRLGHPIGLRFAALTFTAGFAYTLSPGKVGELVRTRYYVPLGIPVRNVTTAFCVERLMDLVAMIVLATLLFTVSAGYASVVAAAGVLVIGVLVTLTQAPWERLALRLRASRRVPQRLLRPLTGIAGALAGTRTLLKPPMLLAGLVMAIVAWGLEGIGLALLASMFPPTHIPLLTALGIYGVAVLLGSLSFMPGGIGGTEAIMTALLATHGLRVSEALLVTLTCRLVTLWLGVAVGWLAVLALRQRPTAMVMPWR